MKQLSYKEILVRLYETTDIQDLNFSELMLIRKIKQFDKAINGVYSIQLKSSLETIADNTLPFPIDAMNIDFVLQGDWTDENAYFVNPNEHIVTLNVSEAIDAAGTLYSSVDGRQLFTNETLYKLWSDISFPTNIQELNFIIADGMIQFDPYYEGVEVTVFYGAYPKNQSGDFLVNENHTDALVNSLKHFLFEKQMFSRKMRGQRLYNDDFSFIRQLRSEKNLSIRNARVEDRKENEKYLNRNNENVYNILIENDLYQ